MKRICLFFSSIVLSIFVYGQSAVVPTGGTASGSGGSVTYTIGQPADIHFENNGKQINEGVQQPYEFFTIGIDDYHEITLNAMIYPNPTHNFVQLNISNYKIPVYGLQAQLYDGNGKFLQEITIHSFQTKIDLNIYPSAVYQLRILDNKTLLKTFKVVKNNI